MHVWYSISTIIQTCIRGLMKYDDVIFCTDLTQDLIFVWVLYIGIMKVLEILAQIIAPKPAWYLLSDTLGEYWLGIAKPKMSSDQSWTLPVNSYEIFKISYLMHFFTDWLTDWLTYLPIPSDKHNSRTAEARDLISSLINASSRDVPFDQPQLLQRLHKGVTFVPLWSPILFFTTA